MSLFRECDGPSCEEESNGPRDLKLHVVVQHGRDDKTKAEHRDFHSYECLEEWLTQRLRRRAERLAEREARSAAAAAMPAQTAPAPSPVSVPMLAPRGYGS